MKRREFMKRVAVGGIGTYILAANSLQAGQGKGGTVDILKGFIVSDAHFGWRGKDQPQVETQREMMKRIMKAFPDLDVFIDTGDAHHNYASDDDKGDWTDVIANGCGSLPFYFVPGNHEIDAWGKKWDPEWNTNKLGSLSCRPYYSFDIKGIHFISIPQMIKMSYISDEAVEWLKLDLELNKDKSTIMLSHNSLEGTTKYFDDAGYRLTANSDVMFKLFERFPQVMAWMHGHNHTYEVEPRKETVYVSNGRIGGFNPLWDNTNDLGGIYFEVGRRHFAVRAWSATQEKFFDQMNGFDHLGHVLKKKTSLDFSAPHAHSYGTGMAIDGREMPVVSHHSCVSGKRELFIAGSDSSLINENPDFAVSFQRTLPDWKKRHLPGYAIEPGEENDLKEDASWEWLDPGVRIKARKNMGEAKDICAPGTQVGQRGYYRCAPGRKYKVSVRVKASDKGPRLKFICSVYDRDRKKLWTGRSDPVKLVGGKEGVQEYIFDVPVLNKKKTIYNDSKSDNVVNMLVLARFDNLSSDVDVTRFEFTIAGSGEKTISPAVIEDGVQKGHEGVLSAENIKRYDLPASSVGRRVYSVRAEGNRRLTWLVRETGIEWQIRNAPVATKKGVLEIGPMRNLFTRKKEIVIAPTRRIDVPYVSRMRNVNLARVFPPEKNKTSLLLKKLLGRAEVDILTDSKPKSVNGVDDWKYSDGVLTLKAGKPGRVDVLYS